MIKINKIELKYINTNIESCVYSRRMFFENKIPIFFMKVELTSTYFNIYIFPRPRTDEDLDCKCLYFAGRGSQHQKVSDKVIFTRRNRAKND